MNKILYSLFMLILWLAVWQHVGAQPDSLAVMRRFLQVCNDYKQLPVQVDVEVRRTSNLVLSRADTGEENVSFYLCKEGSYIVMGAVEQLGNDSLLLLVNKSTKRMILMTNRQSVSARLKQTMGLDLRDSAADILTTKYTVTEAPAVRDTAVIGLQSRADLYYTQAPREEIIMRYHAGSNQPCEVTTVTRRLLSLSDSVFRAASGHAEWAGRTVSVNDSSFYLIREQRTVFRYRRIAHEEKDGLPVRVSDRLVAEGPGRYRPTGSYADFVLSRQF